MRLLALTAVAAAALPAGTAWARTAMPVKPCGHHAFAAPGFTCRAAVYRGLTK